MSKIPTQLDGLQKTITMAHIAKAAGVSQGAISSLLNDRDYGIRVSEKTRERVVKVCRELGYIPNDLRAVVRMYPEVGDYCLLLPGSVQGTLRDPFITRVASAAMAAIPESTHPLSFALYDEARDYLAPATQLPHPVRTGVFSKFLTYGPPNPSLHEALVRRGTPVVSLGYNSPLPGVVSLVPDYAAASHIAIDHLIRLGHRSFGIVSGPFGSDDARLLELNRGVRLAFEAAGVSMGEQAILSGDLSAKAGRNALDEIAEHRPGTTAIFCMSDSAAIGVIAQAQARGLRVPGDYSVVGCSDNPEAETIHPRLTTVFIPAEEMAEAGIRTIDQLIREGMPVPSQKRVLPVRLTERESCAQLSQPA